MSSTFYVIYPRGDRTALSVCEICLHMEYELSDYDVASRQKFYSEREACEYGRDLAKEHGKRWEGPAGSPDYLD